MDHKRWESANPQIGARATPEIGAVHMAVPVAMADAQGIRCPEIPSQEGLFIGKTRLSPLRHPLQRRRDRADRATR